MKNHQLNKNLYCCYRRILASCDILYEKEEHFLFDLVKYIKKSCKFVVMITDNFINAHRIFCTINIAGEPLSALDFYKARLYGHLVEEKGLSLPTGQFMLNSNC
jgi:hypothetical protein